jgi:hypothetical protein
MALYEIPPDLLRDLLHSVEGEISSASPFRFLLVDAPEPDPESYMAYLEEKDLLDSPPEQDGLLALQPSFRRSLDVLARPIRRILIAESKDGEGKRAVYSSDGNYVVFAMFDQENCLVSDPVELETFRDSLVEAIGPPKKSKAEPKPYQFHPAVLMFLGAIQGPWNVENGSGLNKALKWPVARSDVEERLTELIEDANGADQLVDALIGDKVLSTNDDQLDIHPNFKPWHQAITTADFLEIQRVEIPNGDLRQTLSPVQAFFVGNQGKRCLIWPVGDDSGEVLLLQPSGEDLNGLAGYLVGWLDEL